MASIVPRTITDGSTSYQVRWRENGRQRSYVSLGSTDKARRAHAERIKRLIDAHGTYHDGMTPADVPTVTEQAEVFLAQHTRGNADTVREYRRIIAQHIEPSLGQLAITAVTPALLNHWARGLEMADKTRANVTAVASGILRSAVPDWLASNPADRMRVARSDPPRRRAPLTSGELALVLLEVPEHYRPLVIFLAFTGLRWGEVTALTVDDVDLRARVVYVSKAMKHRARQGDEPGRPKTEKSVRTVSIDDPIPALLAPLLLRKGDARLFTAPRGGPVRGSTFHTLVWQPALGRASDPALHGDAVLTHRPRIHDLRAYATTQMIERGVPVDVVSDALGHEKIATTFEVYRRVNPETGRVAAAAMSDALADVLGRLAIEAGQT